MGKLSQKTNSDTSVVRSVSLPPADEISDFQAKILEWYSTQGRDFPWRKNSISQYQKIVSEILLQRTRAETVASIYPSFMRRFPTWKALSTSSEDEISQFIKPIGLWRRRSSVLYQLGREMRRRNGRFPRAREEIESLPGVGQYIANAIELLCFGRALPLLDVNMARVLERYFAPRLLADIRYDPYLQLLSKKIVDCQQPKQINWAVLDLAALICKAENPIHERCPVADGCSFYTLVRMQQGG